MTKSIRIHRIGEAALGRPGRGVGSGGWRLWWW